MALGIFRPGTESSLAFGTMTPVPQAPHSASSSRTNDCGPEGTYGEVGWNHLFQHPKILRSIR